ncbi:MAG: NAD-dependent epimerase/dehydratase family protein [Nitrospirota bacterium]
MTNFSRKKVLVTGGGGFIGNHLSERLLQLGAEVTIYDCHFPDGIKEDIEIIHGDIRDYQKIEEAVKGKEIVFHLAGLLGVENIIDKPVEVLDINLGGTINILKASIKNSVERFIFSSSSEVYGEPLKLPISEKDATSPVSTYGVSKLSAEQYCLAYNQKYDLPVTIIRYFNVYGPRQKEKFVISIFISRIAKNLPPIIYGNGEQIRSYTNIDDAINGTLLAATSEKGVGEVFNIGNDQPVAIKNLAYYVSDLFDKQITPEFRYFGNGIRHKEREINKRIPDISKARFMLDFHPKIDFQTGVKQFIEWYKDFGVNYSNNHTLK